MICNNKYTMDDVLKRINNYDMDNDMDNDIMYDSRDIEMLTNIYMDN